MSGKKTKSHAFLLHGLSGTGKKRAAAQMISQISREQLGEKELFSGRVEDVILLSPQTEEKKGKIIRRDLSVVQAREAINKLFLFPTRLKFRFLLVEQAERLNQAAANSLLKIVEEPPAQVRVIFLSDNLEQFLPTLKSRLEKRFFPLLRKEEMAARLKENFLSVNQELFEKVFPLSQGRIAWAEKFLADEILMLGQARGLDRFRSAIKGGLGESFLLAESLSKDKALARKSIDDWVFYFRGFLLEKISAGQLEKPARKKILFLIRELLLVKERLERPSANSRLIWENFFLSVV